ncbi:hypothetical protein S7711_03194 [Stachybotrys chartarum IBT 7711]|uniref:Uncharacterized protein n=1 Tax=Stachybotrys chartarum (strain CBS 109288 / IBT 7711) TaxID=1280523 RepID=A0A084AWM9_STACB|nr:hypothetical protein S7711_03194 [Stachybotrys chartarum IBT 7711]
MDLLLPSYQQAVAPVDWLVLVTPYVDWADFPALCLVSHRCWRLFAPLLWRDLFVAARRSGLAPEDDIEWWLNFVFVKAPNIRLVTRRLVRSLDARYFATSAYHFASDQDEQTLPRSFRRALTLFDNVDSILLDGHGDLDPGFVLGVNMDNFHHRPRLLSIANSTLHLPRKLFASPYLRDVVFLDVSNIPGSIRNVTEPSVLEHLRVLKIRGREVDDTALFALFGKFRLRLRSLDVSDNRITDEAVADLCSKSFPSTDLRSDARFDIEGRRACGQPPHSQFPSIVESEWSGSYRHPQRYLVDAPGYAAEAHAEPDRHLVRRKDGYSQPLDDSAVALGRALPENDEVVDIDAVNSSRGLTHLHLSRNEVSCLGLTKLLQLSNGQLENLSCDSMPLLPLKDTRSTYWPKSARLHGFVGDIRVFRPVISPNLQVLRVHHSLVTRIPTLETEGLSILARLYLSETSVLPRTEQAYPQTFIPDLNPRLVSLTLTCVPRRSCGPLIAATIGFLKRLAEQEQAIQEASMTTASWRAPRLLQGLRHLRLEFEPDPMDDGFSASEDLDAQELLNSGDQGFSFFDQEWNENTTSNPEAASDAKDASHTKHVDHKPPAVPVQDSAETLTYTEIWNGETFSVPVWTGTPASPPGSFINDYRRLVFDHGLQDNVGPATPCQVKSGAPEGSYIFQTAWCAAVMPRQLRQPSRSQLAQMKDVLDELKKFRGAEKARYMKLKKQNGPGRTSLGEPHYFWRGKLEVSMERGRPHFRPSQYWR